MHTHTLNRKRPVLGKFNHIALEVRDLSEAIPFYEKVLGLTNLPMPDGLQEKGIYWFDLGNSLALHLVEKSGTIPGSKAHIAISVDDVHAWRHFLDALGIKYAPPRIQIYKAERIFLNDPSGNRIELVRWL